jgi:two-component system sensor histidine kinase YesM
MREEIELVKNYLNIQQIRYGDQLTYILNCSEVFYDFCFPHMVLQPIIENAIRYSLEIDGNNAHIQISVQRDADDLKFRNPERGSQFEDDFLHKLEQKEVEVSGFGIGLLNIQQRIQLTYGESYGLKLYNNQENAVVQITIPCIRKEEVDAQNDDC